MIFPIQPPVPPANVATTTPVNTVVSIQAINSTTAIGEGSGGASPLAHVANGTTIEGFVVNRDAQSNPILRTAIGDLRVTSEVFLKTGSEVTIRVDNTATSLARIISVDGLTPQDYNTQTQATRTGITHDTITSSALQPLLNNAATATPKAGVPAANAPTLQAVILQSQPAVTTPSLLATAIAASQSTPVQALAQLTQLRAGTPIRLTVIDIKLPPVPVALGALPQTTKLDSLLPPRPVAVPQQQQLAPAIGNPPLPSAPIEEATPPLAQPTQPTPASRPIFATATAIPERSPPAPQLTPATGQPTPAPSPALPVATPLPEASPRPQPTLAANPAAESEFSPLQTAIATKNAILSTAQSIDIAEPLPTATRTTQAAIPSHNPVTHSLASFTSTPYAPAAAPTNLERPALTPTAPDQIVADVIGHDADGANILHTSFATLKVYTPQPLPTGTTLLVSAHVETDTTLTPHASVAEEQLASSIPKSDTVIDEVLAWISTTHPDAAREILQRLPNAQRNLASGLLFFIAAMKGGDLGEALGKRTLRALETNAPEILTRLRQEVSQIQNSIADSPLMHWTQYPLSMIVGNEMQHARLYVSKDTNDSAASAGGTQRGQRFVLEVDLSQLGAMQFDGFVRNTDSKKIFDLMVRSAQPLEQPTSQAIRTIFENSLAITGLRGQLIFQQGSQHFIPLMADTKPRSSGDGLNTILA